MNKLWPQKGVMLAWILVEQRQCLKKEHCRPHTRYHQVSRILALQHLQKQEDTPVNKEDLFLI